MNRPSGEQLIVLGTADGDIHAWSFEPTASTSSPDTLKKESGVKHRRLCFRDS